MKIINDFNTTVKKALTEIDPNWESYDGLIICGTHTPQKVESIIEEIRKARENRIPTFGICAGMQLMAIEYARNVLGIKDATSEEFGDKGTFIVKKLPQIRVGMKDVTGLNYYASEFGKEKRIFDIETKSESHWHNYYVDHSYFINKKLNNFSINFLVKKENGINISEYLCVFNQIPPYFDFFGVQYHPEYQSSKDNPHPLLVNFLNHCKNGNKM